MKTCLDPKGLQMICQSQFVNCPCLCEEGTHRVDIHKHNLVTISIKMPCGRDMLLSPCQYKPEYAPEIDSIDFPL